MKRFHALRTRLLGAITVALVATVSVASAQWVAGADAPHSPDYWGFADAYHDGMIYTFGGVSNGRLLNATASYDIDQDMWEAGNNLFAGLYYAGAAAIDDKVYVVGGQVGNGVANYSSGMAVLNPTTGTITSGSSMGAAISQVTAVAAGGKLYVIGGRSQNPAGQGEILMRDIQVYTPGGSWQTISGSLPVPLTLTQAAAEGNTIYVAGGLTVNQNGQLVIVNVAYKGTINGSTISWTPIANLPVGIYGGDMTMLEGRPLIAGGSNGTDGYSNAYLYDPGKNVWEPFYQTPYTALQGRLSGDGSSAVLIGGGDQNATHIATLSGAVPVASFGGNAILVTSQAGPTLTRTIAVGNGGLADLTVTPAIPQEAESWLSASAITVEPAGTGAVSFAIATDGLADGVYSTTVLLNHNDEAAEAHEVDVLLYIGDVEEQDMKVVIEEASGDWCGWCPDGHAYLNQLESAYPDDVIILSYHGGTASEPLSFPEGTGVLSMLSTNSYPSAAVNRIIFPGESGRMVNRGNWVTYTEAVLDAFENAPVALEIEDYSFDPQTRKVTATINATTAAWLSTDVANLRLTAVITQQNIYTRQVDYIQNTTHASYHQKHAVRHVWPSAQGSTMSLSSTETVEGYFTPGRKGSVQVDFTVPQASGVAGIEIKPEDAHIAFFVHTGVPGMILQGIQRDLEGGSVAGPSISVDFGNERTRNINAEETTSFDVVVTNNRSEPTVVTLTRLGNTMPAGWTSEVCTGANDCDDADVVTYTIPADASHTFSLKVTGATAGKTGTVRLAVASSDVTQDGTFTVNTSVSSVRVTGERNGLSLASVTPNPASSIANVEITLPSTSETTLEVFTTTGQKVATLFEGRLESGSRTISADVTGLESGKYVLVLTAGETKVSRTLTVVR